MDIHPVVDDSGRVFRHVTVPNVGLRNLVQQHDLLLRSVIRQRVLAFSLRAVQPSADHQSGFRRPGRRQTDAFQRARHPRRVHPDLRPAAAPAETSRRGGRRFRRAGRTVSGRRR